ncbi:MAG: ester cyclase [Ignavibacteriaceae bacterium]
MLKSQNGLMSILLFLITLFLFSACQEQKKAVNIEPLIKSYVEVWNTGDIDKLDSIVTENFELRIDPAYEPLIGIDSLKKVILDTRKMFPDFTVNLQKHVPAGDTVSLDLWTLEGTYSGNTGTEMESRKISVPGFSVIFYSGNRITGEWIAYSDLTLMKQIGFTLVPPKGSKK